MSDPLITCACSDEALDVTGMGDSFGEWLRTRDIAKAKLSGTPTKFHLGHIDMMGFRSFVSTAPDATERAWRAFEMGVLKVEMANGQVMLPAIEDKLASGAIRHRWSEAQMAMFAPCDVEDIGTLCWVRSHMGKGRAVRYPLPPSLPSVLMARMDSFPVAAGNAMDDSQS